MAVERDARAPVPGGPGPLWLALGVRRGDVVAFTGGGGKTSLCRVLAGELASLGWRVVYATTAKMGAAPGMPLVIRDEVGPGWLDAVSAHLDRASGDIGAAAGGLPVCAAAALRGDGKLLALDSDDIEALAARADAVVVEADGSAGRSLKAPGEHEPAIPACATIVCPVAGLDGVGQPLEPRYVHRAERFAELTGARAGEAITPAQAAAAICHPGGLARGAPAGSRVVFALNKMDAPGAPQAAAALAAELLASGARRIVATAAGAHLEGRVRHPVFATTGTAIGVVLAAGAGRRFAGTTAAAEARGSTDPGAEKGAPPGKLLRTLADQPLIRHVAGAALAAGLAGVAIVVGPRDGRALRDALAGEPLWFVDNPDAGAGIATSVAAATRFAFGWSSAPLPAPRGLMFLLGDQPLIGARVIDRIVAEFVAATARSAAGGAAAGAPGGPFTGLAVAARAGGEVVSPNLFGRELWSELLSLEGDTGGRQVLRRRPETVRWVDFADAGAFVDVDVEADLERARVRLEAGRPETPSDRPRAREGPDDVNRGEPDHA